MLELSIEEISFILSALGIVSFACLAVIANDVRSSIINFLIAGMFTGGFIAVSSDITIAVVLSLIYISMASLLLTITNEQRDLETGIDTYMITTVVFLFILALFIYKHCAVKFISEKQSSHYAGITEITLMASLLFLFVLSGLTSLSKKV